MNYAELRDYLTTQAVLWKFSSKTVFSCYLRKSTRISFDPDIIRLRYSRYLHFLGKRVAKYAAVSN